MGTPLGAYGIALGGGGAGGVSLTPGATQTIVPTLNGATGLQIQHFGATLNPDFALIGVNGTDVYFSVGLVSNGINSRNPIVKIGINAVGPNEYQFNAGPIVAAGVGGGVLPNFDFPIMITDSATTPTTPVASTNILGAAIPMPAGLYEVTVYYVVTTAGVGGTAITFNLSFTDPQQAQTDSTLTSSGIVLGQFAKAVLIIYQQAAGNVTYTITETGVFSTHPVLALKIAIKRVL
jgi:hypothetical protein